MRLTRRCWSTLRRPVPELRRRRCQRSGGAWPVGEAECSSMTPSLSWKTAMIAARCGHRRPLL